MKQFIVSTCLHVLLLSSLLPACHAQKPSQKLDRFLKIAEDVRKSSGVPGAGIAIVYKGEIVFAGGLGNRDLQKQTPVDKNTLFCIGSNTKAFTAFLANKLRTRKLIDWDQPLVRYVPEFKLKEEYVTQHATIADALSHRVGLGRNDRIWKYKSLTRKELLPLLADLNFTSSFRNGFDYNNLMYCVAGIAMERVTKTSWENLVQKEIFAPLGMDSTVTSMTEFSKSKQAAIGYHADGIRRARVVDLKAIAPAGAIYSTPEDIAVWVKMLMNGGNHNGKPLMTKEEYDYWLRPRNFISIRNQDEMWFYNGGLGGFEKNGKRVVGANGAIDGQNSRCVLRLDEGLGIFVMTNQVSAYKELICQYAEQIFLKDDFTRDAKREKELAQKYAYNRFVTRLLDESMESAKSEHDRLPTKPSESSMDRLGKQFLAQNGVNQAIFIFKLNAQNNPQSATAHESLAKAYLRGDQKKLATEHLRTSLKLSPNNTDVKKLLEKIQKQKDKH